MAKKEINVFSVSFLDILSGALAAVIILFIIVPKVDIEQMEQLKALDEAEMMVTDLDSLIHLVSSTVPDSEYVAIVEVTKKLQATIGSLKTETNALQQQLSSKTAQNKRLQAELQEVKKQQEQMQKQLAQAQKESKSTPTPTPQKPQEQQPVVRDSTPGIGDFQVGMNPPLTVMIDWEDSKDIVHLYMKKTDGNLYCYYSMKRRITPFGRWVRFPKKFTKKPHEAIVQNDELVPGEYEIYAQVSRPRKEGKVNIEGFVALNPTEGTPQKIDFGKIELESAPPPYSGKASGESLLGTLTVTENNIQWEPNK